MPSADRPPSLPANSRNAMQRESAQSLDEILANVQAKQRKQPTLASTPAVPIARAPLPTERAPKPITTVSPAKSVPATPPPVAPRLHRGAVKLLDDLSMRHAITSGVTEQMASEGVLNVDLLRALDAYNAAGGWEACSPKAPEAQAVPLWLRKADRTAQVQLAVWHVERGAPTADDLTDPGEPTGDEERAHERSIVFPRPNPQTRDEQVIEYLKCRRSVVYFIDNYCHLEHKVKGVIPFRLWRWQAWLLYRWQANPLNIALKARQIGVSELAAAYCLWLIRFYATKTCLFISKSEDDAMVLLGRAKVAVSFLPAWLYPGSQQCLDPCVIFKENTQIFELAHLDRRGKPHRSLIQSLAATQGAGRSRTAAVVVLDEWAHMLWAEQIWSAVEATADGGGIIIGISTANGFGNMFADTWEATQRMRATAGREAQWKAQAQQPLDAQDVPMDVLMEAHVEAHVEAPAAATDTPERAIDAADTVEVPETEPAPDMGRVESLEGLFFPVFLSWRRHPDRTRRWYDTKLRMAQLKGKRFVSILHQEYPSEPTEAFIQSGRPVFDAEILTRQVRRLREEEAQRLAEGLPPWREAEDGLILYEIPVAGHRYIIGADVAEGLPQGDYDDASVIDRETGREVAALHGHWPMEVYAGKLDKLGRYFNDALLAIERNNHGHTVLLALTSGLAHERWAGKREPYRNLYHAKNDLTPGRREDARPGWESNVRTKPLAVDALDRMMREDAVAFRNELFLTVEALIFSYEEKGVAMGAPAGKNDDSVSSRYIAAYLLAQPDHAAQALAYIQRYKEIVDERVALLGFVAGAAAAGAAATGSATRTARVASLTPVTATITTMATTMTTTAESTEG